ncbi:MAG TPA: VOC family protein [Gemmatimonadaceae bacterium]|jgi:catechol 2,3-dioxygenase-like lactoylglutathione lyase family enzyme|nr:VOC family protein [Gemmatimonadaceae bacterium]
MRPIDRVLEACLYAHDLEAAERFYAQVLGLERYSSVPGRHVFFRCGDGMFLVFNAERTRSEASVVAGAIVPTHGATGPGHVAFAIPDAEIPAWRTRLEQAGITIESEVMWPRGGRSLYFRDPAGNCVELASPTLWGFRDPPLGSDVSPDA